MENVTPYNHPYMVVSKECFCAAKYWHKPNHQEVKYVLAQSNLNEKDFAVLVNVSDSDVQSWLTGTQNIPYSVWCLLCLMAGYGEIWRY